MHLIPRRRERHVLSCRAHQPFELAQALLALMMRQPAPPVAET